MMWETALVVGVTIILASMWIAVATAPVLDPDDEAGMDDQQIEALRAIHGAPSSPIAEAE